MGYFEPTEAFFASEFARLSSLHSVTTKEQDVDMGFKEVSIEVEDRGEPSVWHD